MLVKRRQEKPKREDVQRTCPNCGELMPFAAEDEKSVTLSCHGWNFQEFGDKAKLWRTLHIGGVAQPHEWNAAAPISQAAYRSRLQFPVRLPQPARG